MSRISLQDARAPRRRARLVLLGFGLIVLLALLLLMPLLLVVLA